MSASPIADLYRLLGHCAINDCWEYQLGLDKDGYGGNAVGSRKTNNYRRVRVHRFVYEQLVGPIPEGYQIDHLCKNKRCCNPDHLEPVLPVVNVRRGVCANRVKQECPHGHGPEFYYKRPNRNARSCRKCDILWVSKKAA